MANGSNVAVSLIQRGSLYSSSYRLYYKNMNRFVSPWHDVPLFAYHTGQHQVFNMIVEIPRWSNAKIEIATKEPLNPLKQDMKNEQPRFVHNIFPHKGYIWNYGAFPQTWEDPAHIEPDTGAKGDNDPVDVIEIGSVISKSGLILQVKVLGVLALIDEGETDWKVVAIDINDPLANEINEITDVEKHMPGLLSATVEWFRFYKIPAGKPANKFAFDDQFKDREFAENILAKTHEFWKDLITDPQPSLNTECIVEGAALPLSPEVAEKVVDLSPQLSVDTQIPDEVDKWHYISF